MKTAVKLIVYCAALGLAAVPSAFAQASQQQRMGSGQSGMQQSSQTTHSQFYHIKQIIGTEAKNAQGQELGTVHDIVFNPQNCQVFAAISVENGRYALVPWQAVSVTSQSGQRQGWLWWGNDKEQVTINATKQELQSGPAISGRESQKLSDPTFTQSIYSHYRVQQTTGMGGGGEQGLGGSQLQSEPRSGQQGTSSQPGGTGGDNKQPQDIQRSPSQGGQSPSQY